MGIVNVGLENQAHPAPGIHIPERPTPPNAKDKPLAAPHRGIGRRLWDAISNMNPGQTEASKTVPISEITDAKVAGIFAGVDPRGMGVSPKMSERTLMATLGWSSGASGYYQARTAVMEIAKHLEEKGGITAKTEKGMIFMSPGNPDVLRDIVVNKPAALGDTWEEQRDAAERVKHAQAALDQHTDILSTPTQSSTPPAAK